MATLKKYNLEGNQVGVVDIDDSFLSLDVPGQMIKDYIVALRANLRQWSASTKTRAEVSHTTKKPFKQKGQGRARQGCLVAPQYRGGGRVGAPRPKFDQHVRINRKEKRAAIHYLMAEKMREGKLVVVESLEMVKPRTKQVASFLNATQMAGRVLFLSEGSFAEVEVENRTQKVSLPSDKNRNFVRSVRNIPAVEYALVSNVNGYHVACAQQIVMTPGALVELQKWLATASA